MGYQSKLDLSNIKNVREKIYRSAKVLDKSVPASELQFTEWDNGGVTAIITDKKGNSKSCTVLGEYEKADAFRLVLEVATKDDPEGRFHEGNERLALIAL